MQNLKTLLTSDKTFEKTFWLWFLCFPFGSFFLSFSLGFFTMYPFLLVSGILFLLTLFHKPARLKGFFKIIIVFWMFWFLYALMQLFLCPIINRKDAIFDLRSLFLFAFTIYLLLQSEKILGWEKFKKNISGLSGVLLVVFIMVGFFEFFTGIHIAGMHTLKLLAQPVSQFTYTPVFIFDNPNNFITYYVLLSLIVILFNDKINRNLWAVSSLNILIFFFSYIADARFGKISSYIIFFVCLFIYMPKEKITSYILALLFALLCFISHPLFFGPIWKDGKKYQLNEIICLQSDSTLRICKLGDLTAKYSEDTILAKIEAYKNQNANSNDVRLKLIENGLYLTKTSNFLGVGPGQYVNYHRLKKVPNDVGTQLSAHSWLIEILSQYGILIFLGYTGLFGFVFFKSMRHYKRKKVIMALFLLSILAFFMVSNLPSAFLLLDINWVYTGLIFIFYKNELNPAC